jgi:hypothetical protein
MPPAGSGDQMLRWGRRPEHPRRKPRAGDVGLGLEIREYDRGGVAVVNRAAGGKRRRCRLNQARNLLAVLVVIERSAPVLRKSPSARSVTGDVDLQPQIAEVRSEQPCMQLACVADRRPAALDSKLDIQRPRDGRPVDGMAVQQGEAMIGTVVAPDMGHRQPRQAHIERDVDHWSLHCRSGASVRSLQAQVWRRG